MKDNNTQAAYDSEGLEVDFLTEEEARILVGQLSEIEDSWFLSGYQRPDSALLQALQA